LRPLKSHLALCARQTCRPGRTLRPALTLCADWTLRTLSTDFALCADWTLRPLKSHLALCARQTCRPGRTLRPHRPNQALRPNLALGSRRKLRSLKGPLPCEAALAPFADIGLRAARIDECHDTRASRDDSNTHLLGPLSIHGAAPPLTRFPSAARIPPSSAEALATNGATLRT